MEKIKTFPRRFYEGWRPFKITVSALVGLLYVALTVYGGGSLTELFLFWLVAAVYLVLPGFFFTKLLKVESWMPGYGGPLAWLAGAGFLAVLYCTAMYMGWLPLLYGLPPCLAAAWAVLKLLDAKRQGLQKTFPLRFSLRPWQWMLVLLFFFLLLVYTFAGVVKNALPLSVGNTLMDQDLLWNAGNANSFKLAFPPIDIRYFDVRLSYHYFTEMLAGILSLVSGIDAYRIVGFYFQPLMLGTMVFCLYRLACLLWPGDRLRNVLLPFSLFLFSCASLWKVLPNGLSVFWNQNITHLITNINSQTTAFTVLSIFVGLFVAAARKQYRICVLHFLFTCGAFAILCVSKGPMAAIVAAALGLTLLLGLFLRQTGWRGLLLGAALGLVFAVFYFVLFSSGASSSTQFSSYGTLEAGFFGDFLRQLATENVMLSRLAIPILYLVQTFLMMPAQVPLFVRGLGHDLRRFSKLSPERMLFYAAGIGGTLAFFVVRHPHMSQVYFLFTGVFFITLLALGNLKFLCAPAAQAPKRKTSTHRVFVGIVAAFAAVGLVTAGFLYTNLLGSGARRLAFNLGVMEKYPYDVVMSPGEQEGLEWLRDNSPKDMMFATNRIHTGQRLDGISNFYSGLSGRQGFMEGFQYAVTNMGVSQASVNERLAVNEALFSAATPPEEILRLCRQWGITHLLYSTQLPGEESQLAFLPKVFDSDTLRIYEIPEGS